MNFYVCLYKCGEWTYLFATTVANIKLLLDIVALDAQPSACVDIKIEKS